MNPYSVPDLEGRVAVVTGSTAGIGLWTAAGLAKAGADVVLMGRNAERGREAQAFVKRQGGGREPALFLTDFADLKRVAQTASELKSRFPAIHMLVNNAGLFSPRWTPTRDGYETTFAVNHLAPFLLTNLLLPQVRAAGMESRKARIVNVASAAAQRASIDLDDLMWKNRRYSMLAAYSTSKLANVLFTKELARRLAGSPVTANCLHPGVVATNIGSKGGVIGFGWNIAKPFFLTEEQGAINSLYVASAPEIETMSGAYFVKQRAVAPNPLADDPVLANRLWEESERLVNAALSR
jgi:NAD(P)-dependent dehydrogenase (short-subunit alcohol dehydrogenase family)